MPFVKNWEKTKNPLWVSWPLFWPSVVALVVFATIMRCIGLDSFPAILHNDEASCVLHGAYHFVTPGHRWAMWGSAFGGHPNFSYWLSSLVAQLTGDPSLSTIRLASGISGVLSLLIFTLCLLKSFGQRIAIFFLLFAVPYHFHVHFSRTAFNYIHSALLFSLTSLCLAYHVDQRSLRSVLLLGAVLGISALGYPATHVLPFCALGTLAIGARSPGRPDMSFIATVKAKINGLCVGLLGFAVVVAPQVYDAMRNGYSSRLSSTFILMEHNLRHLAPQTGDPNASVVEVVWFNFLRTLMFFTSHDEGEQYRFVETPIDPFFGGVAVLGALALLWRCVKREPLPLFFIGVAASTIAASTMMVEGPFSPHLALFVILTPLAIGFGWDSLMKLMRLKNVTVVTLVSIVAFTYWSNWNVHFYGRVVSPERSRIADLENAISFLPVERARVSHLINSTPKPSGFGETYYQLMYPNAIQTKLPPGDLTRLEEFLRDKQCPCVVAVELDNLESAKDRVSTTNRKVAIFPRPEKKFGFLYIE